MERDGNPKQKDKSYREVWSMSLGGVANVGGVHVRPMNRRRLLLIGLPLLLAGLAAVGAWVLYESPHVRAYHRLRLGMTRSDAINAIGEAPGDYRSQDNPNGWEVVQKAGLPHEELTGLITEKQNGLSNRVEAWMWDDVGVFVAYDDAGEVIGYYLLTDATPSFLDILRANLGL